MTIHEAQQEVLRLKRETSTCVLAHSYQAREILEVADVAGDSFALSEAALQRPEPNMLLCGVRFMAEGVKLLSPGKRVVLANPAAGCPMAERFGKAAVLALKARYPDHTVVCYINTTAEVKTTCDVCVTSSSAVEVVRKISNDKIIFVPDCSLGAYVQAMLPEKRFVLPLGGCPYHAAVAAEDVKAARAARPNALLLVHPECRPEVAALADYVGSTAGIMQYAKESPANDFIIGTENSIVEHLQYDCPDKRFYPLSPNLLCPEMKRTTLPDVLLALQNKAGEEIRLDEAVLRDARVCVDAMLELSTP